MQIYKYIILK